MMTTRDRVFLGCFLLLAWAVSLVAQSTVGVFTSLRINGNTITQSAGSVAVVLPAASDTLVGKATTDAFTGKTYNAEGTGNVLTLPFTVWFPAAVCDPAGAYAPLWSTAAATVPGMSCLGGTNVEAAQLDFADGSDGRAWQSFKLPSDWTGAVDLKLFWKTSATSGDVKWDLQTVCPADNEDTDPAMNAAQTITDTAKAVANRLNLATQTGLTTTGCGPDEWFVLKVHRDGTASGDTIAATAHLIGVEFTYRRAI